MPHAVPDADDGRLSLPQIIAEEVKREMQASARPTLRKEVVPDQYQILVYPDDYDWLSPVEEDLLEEIGEELDEVLTELNEGTNYWLELLEQITRIPLLGGRIEWFARPLVRRKDRSYEVRGPWQVEIVRSENVPQGDVLIEAWVSEEAEGDTDTVRGYSERAGGDKGKTATDPFKTFSSSLGNALGDRGKKEKTTRDSEPTYACLTYPDENGETETFEMTERKIKVGRGSPSTWVHLRLDFVEKDISREHLKVRYNSDTDRIEVKDVSKYGTVINGTTIDEKEWHPISDGARIVLAGRDDVPIDVEIPSE